MSSAADHITKAPVPSVGPPPADHPQWIIPVAVLVPIAAIAIVIVPIILCIRRKRQAKKSKISNTELHRLSRIDRSRNATSLQYSDSLRIQPLRVNLPPQGAGGPGSRATYCLANEIDEDVSGGYSPLCEFDSSDIPAPTKGAAVNGNNQSDYDFIPSDGPIPMAGDDAYDHIPPPNTGAAKKNPIKKKQKAHKDTELMVSGDEYDHIPLPYRPTVQVKGPRDPPKEKELMPSGDEYDHIPPPSAVTVKGPRKPQKDNELLANFDEYDQIPDTKNAVVSKHLNGSNAGITVSSDEYDHMPNAGSTNSRTKNLGIAVDDEYDHIPTVANANVNVINISGGKAETSGLTPGNDDDAYNRILRQDQAVATVINSDEYDHIPTAKPAHVTIMKKPEDDSNMTTLMQSSDEYDHIPNKPPANIRVMAKPQDNSMETDSEYDHIPSAGPAEVTVITIPQGDDDDDEDDDEDEEEEEEEEEAAFGQMLSDDECDDIPGSIPVRVVNKLAEKGPFVGKPRFLVKDEGGANDEANPEGSDNDHTDDNDEDDTVLGAAIDEKQDAEESDKESDDQKVLKSRRSTKSTKSAKVLVADNTLYEETCIDVSCGSPTLVLNKDRNKEDGEEEEHFEPEDDYRFEEESDKNEDNFTKDTQQDKVATPKVLVDVNNLYEGLPEPSTPVIDPNNPANNPTRLSARKYSSTYENCSIGVRGTSSQEVNPDVALSRQSHGTNETRSETRDGSFGYITDDDSVFYRSHEYLNDYEEDTFAELEEENHQLVQKENDLSQKTDEVPRTAKVLVADNEIYSSSESDVEESRL